MMIARWQIDARFGHKQTVIDKLRAWEQTIGPQVGVTAGRMLTGSVGAREATVIHEWEVPDLAEIDRVWARLPTIPEHLQWSKDLEPFVVSGTSCWEIFRVL